jgi:DNA-binding transcriptional MerR regulator
MLEIKPGELPNRHWFRIGDISRWLEVEPHVLRFWETEFADELSHLERSKSGQRVYSRRHAVVFGAIKELLYTELYTIAGAKRQLRLAQGRRVAS